MTGLSFALPDGIDTPTVVVDVDALEHNITSWAARLRDRGVGLRPHTKTHKSVYVGREQMRRGAVGLTCATPHEATVMQAVTDDLLVAYPVLGHAKLDRLFTILHEA